MLTAASFTSIETFPYINNLSPFYREVIAGFAQSNTTCRPKNRIDVLNMTLWGNKHIEYKNNDKKMASIYLPNFYHTGLKQVKDLKFINGKIDDKYFI